jgi:hypothetical protein
MKLNYYFDRIHDFDRLQFEHVRYLNHLVATKNEEF